MCSMTSKSSSPDSKKWMLLPLPPKKADVVQKLHPMGHPTEGIIVAAVSRVLSGIAHSQHAHTKSGEDFGMLDGSVRVFAKIAAHPGDAFAAHDEIGINQFVEAREWRRRARPR